MAQTASPPAEEVAARFREDVGRLKAEIGKVIVGHGAIVDGVITCLLTGGHALLEGVPGLGKTMLVRTLAQSVSLSFSRIQFTPDLMPADILGTNVIVEDAAGRKQFEFSRGPVFANIVLADEINRATPKTQSAMLEAMQEQHVTVSRTTFELDQPFLVLATQNPLEMEGTYPLPEAQLDRFLFKLHVRYPSREELHEIVGRTTTTAQPEARPVLDGPRILELRDTLRHVPASRLVQDYAVRLTQGTHPTETGARHSQGGHLPGTPPGERVRKYVRFGASPRGAQALLLGAKVLALLDGRFAASADDVRLVAKPALRHRLILNFEGEAEGITTDEVIDEIIAQLPIEAA